MYIFIHVKGVCKIISENEIPVLCYSQHDGGLKIHFFVRQSKYLEAAGGAGDNIKYNI